MLKGSYLLCMSLFSLQKYINILEVNTMFKFILGAMFGVSITFNIISLLYFVSIKVKEEKNEFEKKKMDIKQKINGNIKTM